MVVQLADPVLTSRMPPDAAGRIYNRPDGDLTEIEESADPMRGIITAAVIAAPIWALLGFVVYRLL
ncbi:MAG TPA: hypothetical protein VGC09_03980 [Rhodopila sp.]